MIHLASEIETRRAEAALQNGAMCHVGKEPIDDGPFYWAFLPPNHLKIANDFQRVVES